MDDIEELRARLDALAPRRVAGLRREDARISLILDVTGLGSDAANALEQALRTAALETPGVSEVRIAQTSERTTRRLIAVGSGKGGVGKSTVSANLAIALARAGRKVGLVDADIYGPSLPKLLGVEGTRAKARDKTLLPVATPYGVRLLSMGQLVAADQAIAWRGPMASGALGQLLDADWGDAEIIVIDLPPGTGDIQLTMIQKYRPAAAVIVSTPQDLALIDAKRAIDLFNKAGVPIAGLVENMAGYACPHCGEVSDPFGRGGAEAAAAALDIAFLGRIPLSIAVRSASDAGRPPAAGTGDEARAFNDIASGVSDWLDR